MKHLRHPADWPPLARALLCIGAFLLVLLLGWHSQLQATLMRLTQYRQQTLQLHNSYQIKRTTVPDLALLQQRHQRAGEDLQLQRQHLSAADAADPTLAAIAEAAQACGLKLDAIKPGQRDTGQDYTTHALTLRLRGPYHGLGQFAAQLAATVPLIVLSEIRLAALDDGTVSMEAVALSFRRNQHDHDQQHHADMPTTPSVVALPYLADKERTPFAHPQPRAVATMPMPMRPRQRGRPQALEAFPLEAMRMVGTISQPGRRRVLLQVDRIVYQAKAGDYLGKNFGMILRIAEHETELEELIAGADGRWSKRSTILALQGAAR